ncbi:MAG: LysE family translocator [Paracoccaceae bacterium]|jgi:threonine/homoserine/homoserine lactone efflux protein|uniref:LysE family translocator n=1 Tax=unclassified Seohaeicola TaxID=2641111 RepID=UPI00237AC592|nr:MULTISPECIES: LysE family translocator [unclassified Seohaeicola]MDD9706735.1 LysE family translocator [Seohaeicola sp. 4SK31]MDD9734441.1 LysE family translocator [Seohaeicola sp. SP36]MDF1706467.1 LysE family translocator [Paracoccaceae bacterium]
MTASPTDLLLYAGAILILFLTPGPVWVALTARALSGGFASAWPLAVGVVLGDILWPLLAILGVAWIVSVFDGFMTVMRYVAAGMFLFMGVMLIRHAGATIGTDSRLTRPGRLAGFMAGVAVIVGNPKAVLFYMGVLPGFFDLTKITWLDVMAILAISCTIPLLGNLLMALSVDRARRLLTSPSALRRVNIVAGILLCLVGLIIPLM